MRVFVATAYFVLSASIGMVCFAQEAPTTRERVKVTASFSYRQDSRERRISELVRSMELRADTQRSVDLKTLNQSPVTTVLELTRFLTSRAYKRADGKPLIDLTF
jgi:hypothetical protein